MTKIDKFIPELNDQWSIKHDTIYFKKQGEIPVLRKIDGIYFVSLDRRITKKVIKITNRLESLNQIFFYCDRLTITEKHIYKQDLDRIVTNYLLSISDEVFFKYINNAEFDFINNLSRFIQTFKCEKIFKKNYDSLKNNHYNKMWMDWYTRREFWQVKNESIRDYYSILERQIKLNIFFS